MILRVPLILLLALFTAMAAAQESCQAEVKFATASCTGQMERCVVISVNSDRYGRKFIHEWQMGDGTTLRGKQIEHCYATYGSYHVVMNLIDSLNGNQIANELTRDLLIAPLPQIQSEAIGVGTEVPMAYTYEPLPGYVAQKVFWDFGDGQFGCGPKPTHVYDTAATITQRVLLTGMAGDRPFAICNSKEVQVRGPNVKARLVTDWFVAFEKKIPGNGRFLQDVTHLAMLNEKGEIVNAVSFTTKDVFIYIKPRTVYTIYAWRGNLFSNTATFNSGNEDEADENLKQAVLKMLVGDPIPFPAVTFDLDKTSLAPEALAAQLNTLKSYPYLFVDIGSYTHTGGRLERNSTVSHNRSEWLKNKFVEDGVDAARLRAVSVQDDKRLLNTCTGSATCAWEDSQFNRKTEFRIASPMK